MLVALILLALPSLLSQFGRGRLSLIAISFYRLSPLFGPCRLSEFTLAGPLHRLCVLTLNPQTSVHLEIIEMQVTLLVILIVALKTLTNSWSWTFCLKRRLEAPKVLIEIKWYLQVCAPAAHISPQHLTFAPRLLENISSFFIEIIMLGTLDFTGSQQWAPFTLLQHSLG